MTDDEMPPADGMDDADDFDDDEAEEAGDNLPEGIKKEIITEGSGWKKPKVADEVCVHYVGTLEANGSEFDSSRKRGDPFKFTLGKGQVIKGWDLGVATMKKGETSKFTLAPEFAYGETGSPPSIPANATLVFEVELISWVSKDDLFGDDGVIKAELKEGTGWKNPKAGDEVLISMRADKKDGTAVEDRTDLEYTMGSGALGGLGKVVDKALTCMRLGEEVSLTCSADYAGAERFPEGGVIHLTLQEIYETKDVSLAKDGSVMKKQLKQGEGFDMPEDCSKVQLSVESATDGSAALPGFATKVLEFSVGDGEVCDAIELAIVEMKKGERAVITVSKPNLVAEAQLGLEGVRCDKVALTVQLKEFEKSKDPSNMSEEEQMEFATSRKDKGSELYKAGRHVMALQRYKKVGELFSYIDDYKEENKAKVKTLNFTCELNMAACYLKLQEHVEARKACDTVLKEDPQNVKAVYRRAQAEFGLKDFLESIRDCKRVVELDPQNKEARALLKQAHAGQREEDRKSKGLFASMCKALGKSPISQPQKHNAPAGMEIDGNAGNVEMHPPPAAPPAEGMPANEVAGSEAKKRRVEE